MIALVHKYTVEIREKPTILSLPEGSKILSCGVQCEVNGEQLRVWASVGEGGPVIQRHEEHFVYTVLTGSVQSLPAGARFLGTVLFDRTAFVVHVYVKEPQ